MMPRHFFALAYLGGTGVGLLAGHVLPWWSSGAAAWGLAFALMLFFATAKIRPHAEPKAVVAGAFFGALAGAVAADTPELVGLFVWPCPPGHFDGSLAAFLVALAWALGEVLTPPESTTYPVVTPRGRGTLTITEDDFRPTQIGLFLYLVVLALCALPVLVEIL